MEEVLPPLALVDDHPQRIEESSQSFPHPFVPLPFIHVTVRVDLLPSPLLEEVEQVIL
jgi:hypothetical protein